MSQFWVITFGCQMNKHDSERLAEVLVKAGYDRAKRQEDAVVIIVNTCSVRAKAEHKLRSALGRLAGRKRAKPDLLLVVAGCVAQQEGTKLLTAFPSLDVVLGPDNIAELPELLERAGRGYPPVARTEFDLNTPRFLTAPTIGVGKPCAYVTIMKGCNERCSFCVVPQTRGPERYRPSPEIVDEIAQLVARGVREVTLLGQTVNSYVDPSRALPAAPGADPADDNESEFAALLRQVARQAPQLLRLRYESPHPRHLTRSLVWAHRDLDVLVRHLHLPVQSGSDSVLRRMIRRHSRADFLERVGQLHAVAPETTLSTDIIVGFCGETDEDFQQTLSLIEQVGFVSLFGFKYSPRPNTPALRLSDDVPEPIKAQRLARAFELSEQLTEKHLNSLVGSTQQVLVEGAGDESSPYPSGRTVRNEIVHIVDAEQVELTGQLVSVRIVEAYKHSLAGRLVAGE